MMRDLSIKWNTLTTIWSYMLQTLRLGSLLASHNHIRRPVSRPFKWRFICCTSRPAETDDEWMARFPLIIGDETTGLMMLIKPKNERRYSNMKRGTRKLKPAKKAIYHPSLIACCLLFMEDKEFLCWSKTKIVNCFQVPPKQLAGCLTGDAVMAL